MLIALDPQVPVVAFSAVLRCCEEVKISMTKVTSDDKLVIAMIHVVLNLVLPFG